MTYATQRDAIIRTRQDLVVVGVRECQNSYAALIQQYVTYTEEFDNAAWAKSSMTATPNTATAPDGTLTADTLTFDADFDNISQTLATGAVTSKAYTASVWLRSVTGTARVDLTMHNVAVTEGAADTDCAITTTWTRFWVHYKFSGTPVDALVLKIIRVPGQATGAIYAWGANVYRNPGDRDAQVYFPYTKRVAEAIGTVAVNVSRCEISDQGNGSRCYYSRPTCQDPDNFNAGHTYETTARGKGLREFRFCRKNAPLPLAGEEVLPYLINVPTAAQEIDAERAITVNERATFEFEDDASPGIWNVRQSSESMLVNTATGTGTFWRRWAAIYRNYGNPEGYVIRKVGFVEAAGTEADYQSRGKYLIRNWEAIDRKIKLTCGDRLKLTRKSIPAKIDETNLLTAKITSGATSMIVSDASQITTPAINGTDYLVVIELEPDTSRAEKVNVTAIDLNTNTVTIQRGRWGTTATSHARQIPFREVAEFGTERATPSSAPLGKNPIDIVLELYHYTGLGASEIDSAALQSERDTWLPSTINTTTGVEIGPSFRRTVTEAIEAEELVRQIRDLTMLLMWVNDSQMVTGKLYAPILPTDTATVIDDDSNLIAGSISVDDNDETRISRALIAYNLPAGSSPDSTDDFNQIRIELDEDAEERQYYGEARLKIILTEWLQPSGGTSAEYFTTHLIERFRHGARLLRAKLEIKDDAVGLGSYIQVNTKHIQDVHGNNINSIMQVVKKKQLDDRTFEIEALDTGLFHRYFFWAPDGLPDYTSATDDNKKYGYYSDDRGFVGTPVVPAYDWW